MKRLYYVLLALVLSACVHNPPQPPPTPTPTPSATATPTPEPLPSGIATGYFLAGARWEQATQAPHLHTETRSVTNAIRLGGFDNQVDQTYTRAQQLERFAFYVRGIFSDPAETRALIPALTYIPGEGPCSGQSNGFAVGGGGGAQSSAEWTERGWRVRSVPSGRSFGAGGGGGDLADACWDEQIAIVAPYWSRVLYIEDDSLDETPQSADAVRAIHGQHDARLAALGLPHRPFALTQTEGQLSADPSRCLAADICQAEFYGMPPLTGDRAALLASLRASWRSMIARLGGHPFVAILRGYNCNYDCPDHGNVQAVLIEGARICAEEPTCLGVSTFSYARPSGTREWGWLAYWARALAIVLHLPDPGTEPEPPAMPTPTPAPIIGGAIQPVRKATLANEGDAMVTVELIRDTTRGWAAVDWSAPSLGATGTAVFEDGQSGAGIALALPAPDGQPLGYLEHWIELSHPQGQGVVLADARCRVIVWDAEQSVQIQPKANGPRGDRAAIGVYCGGPEAQWPLMKAVKVRAPGADLICGCGCVLPVPIAVDAVPGAKFNATLLARELGPFTLANATCEVTVR